MALLLKVIAGPDAGKAFPVPADGSLTVGRGEVDIVLTDGTISRQHFRLTAAAGRVSLQDLGSRTGTIVNSAAARAATPLKHGDVIVAGQSHIQVHSSAAAGDTTASLPVLRPAAPARPAPLAPAPTLGLPPAARPAPGPRPAEGVKALASLVNTAFGHFTLGAVLGVGRTGVVFRALDNRDRREVALKVFVPEFSRDEEELQRFKRAARTIAPLRHLNLVELYGAGRENGKCWLSMELVEGPAVAWLVQQAAAGNADWPAAMRVLLHGTRALIFLHGKQILHRNLTPQNVLMSRADGVVKVGDLMTAKSQEGKPNDDLTSTGVILGDPSYVAPERAGDASEGDERSDLYSLGALVYATLTGRPPFVGSSPLEIIAKARNDIVTPPRKLEPMIPQAVEDVVMRLLAKLPERRFDDATALLRHLVERRLIEP